MKTLRRYLWREIVTATAFVLMALLSLFAFFELINQLDDVGQASYHLRTAFGFVLLKLPALAYELMPIAALIGTIYALSKLAANSEFTIMRVAGMSTLRLAGAITRVGLVFVFFTYLLAELVAPQAEALAQRLKLAATGSSITQNYRSGVWVRDVMRDADGQAQVFRFINVEQVRPDATVQAWRIFEFDSNFRLRAMIKAQSGRHHAPTPDSDEPSPTPSSLSDTTQSYWKLKDVVQTRIPAVEPGATTPSHERTEVQRLPELIWPSELTPDIFGVLLVRPERMAAASLVQYIRHLAGNRQQTGRYEIAFWTKLFYPLAVLVMMALALPFAYLHVRAGSVSLKIFTGVMIGVLFYMLNKLFGHLGLLGTWPPIFVAALPSLLMLSIALGALYWIERR